MAHPLPGAPVPERRFDMWTIGHPHVLGPRVNGPVGDAESGIQKWNHPAENRVPNHRPENRALRRLADDRAQRHQPDNRAP
jgi:hypothetical protein